MLNLVLFGPPGAGKGTQAEFLINTYHLNHLSTGEMLRNEISRQTSLGNQAKKYIDKGELVPDSVVICMIRQNMESNPDAKGFIFDGFPRTVDQAIALDKLLEKQGAPLKGMLSLEVEEHELIDRLLKRGLISGRSDDQDLSIIKNRIEVYNQKTAPLIRYYSDQGKYYSVNGMGDIAQIADRLKTAVADLQKSKTV
ncbi:MAG TPA: adenylate kinase [Prolixibacteraceae bacterium]|nr:adenylate kinase [Prolixibacteraceae bacterium]